MWVQTVLRMQAVFMSGCSRSQYEWLFSDLPSVLSAVSTADTEYTDCEYVWLFSNFLPLCLFWVQTVQRMQIVNMSSCSLLTFFPRLCWGFRWYRECRQWIRVAVLFFLSPGLLWVQTTLRMQTINLSGCSPRFQFLFWDQAALIMYRQRLWVVVLSPCFPSASSVRLRRQTAIVSCLSSVSRFCGSDGTKTQTEIASGCLIFAFPPCLVFVQTTLRKQTAIVNCCSLSLLLLCESMSKSMLDS